jgi:4a-hydroxytetrahydrobiopterin dehydratase
MSRSREEVRTTTAAARHQTLKHTSSTTTGSVLLHFIFVLFVLNILMSGTSSHALESPPPTPISAELLCAKSCEPCKGGVPPLSLAAASDMHRLATPLWTLEGAADKLHLKRDFLFKNFRVAMQFVNAVADVAEQEGHHPDFYISYNRVSVEVFTHKTSSLHEADFILAAKVDAVATQFELKQS